VGLRAGLATEAKEKSFASAGFRTPAVQSNSKKVLGSTSLCSRNMRDQVSLPYKKKRGKIVVLYILIFTFWTGQTDSVLHGRMYSINLICSEFLREWNFDLSSSFHDI
jgi:hypothetical protein